MRSWYSTLHRERRLESIVCILIPLTSEQLRIYEWATLALTGGSKGQTALGDAHPYLALFDCKIEPSPNRDGRGSELNAGGYCEDHGYACRVLASIA